VSEVRIAHTAELPPATLDAARALLDAVFAGEFGDADADPVQGTFTTDFPFLVRIDLDGLR